MLTTISSPIFSLVTYSNLLIKCPEIGLVNHITNTIKNNFKLVKVKPLAMINPIFINNNANVSINAAALIDTLALLFMNIGLIIANGFTFTSLKLFLIVLVMWLTSPISGHLISKLEYVTNEKIGEEIVVNKEEKEECSI